MSEITILQTEHGTWKVIPLTLLRKAAWNYKTSDPARGEKLRNNLDQHGQVENLIVRQIEQDGAPAYEVVNGNHRLDEMKALGMERAVCFDLGAVTYEEAVALAIKTNETRFASDELILAERLRELSHAFDMDDLMRSLPFTDDDLRHYDALLDFNWTAPVVSGSEGEADETDHGSRPAGDASGDDAGDYASDDDFRHISARLSAEAHGVFLEAAAAIRGRLIAEGHTLHDDPILAHGQIIELLAAEYLASFGAGDDDR